MKGIPSLDPVNPSPMEEVKQWLRKQKYIKGFTFTTQASITNNFQITLGGEVRFMYGLNLYVPSANLFDEDLVSLSVNQEKILDSVLWNHLNPQGASGNIMKEYDYFSLPRPMSGSDSITLQWESVNAHKIYCVFTVADGI